MQHSESTGNEKWVERNANTNLSPPRRPPKQSILTRNPRTIQTKFQPPLTLPPSLHTNLHLIRAQTLFRVSTLLPKQRSLLPPPRLIEIDFKSRHTLLIRLVSRS